jgi:hypothetical protein
MGDGPGVGDREEARKPQAGDDNHHAEQQGDRVAVHRLVGAFERRRSGGDHEARPDQGDAGPIDAQAGNPADGECEIAANEDYAGGHALPVDSQSIADR